ncbi:hypothetical protein DESUT3_39120 [Desulfuromonas versatilis]|uniref:SCP domain-containing protein n=1 Tax=Desulfuromonas versatilis TaxID=2802975 RepID=A0ABN6E3D4_9BACT|nr:MopE-related protein [Desulfuromonas versatilis]BCR06843.1 hypothetical protein DESUT3_39120 [Desulfuromonas versatilis]
MHRPIFSKKPRRRTKSGGRWSLGLVLALLGLLLAAGCGGGGGGGEAGNPSGTSPETPVLTGVFIDSPVAGLAYRTPSLSGLTGSGGSFNYRAGEQVVFLLGSQELGRVAGRAIVTPVTLVPGAIDETNGTVTNLCRLLQSLDLDGDPENGIVLPPEAGAELSASLIDFSLGAADFANQAPLLELFTHLNARGVFAEGGDRALRSAAQARAHLRASLARLDDDGDGLSEEQGDCNDRAADIFPGAVEVCGDAIDQDCDGVAPECLPGQPRLWYLDADGDGFGGGGTLSTLERPGPGYFEAAELKGPALDCDDADPGRHPGATEWCGDGIDQDCSGADLACPQAENRLWFRDADRDGYSDGSSLEAPQSPGPAYAEARDLDGVSGDCDDGDFTRRPGATEVCGDGIDQDCDGADLACPVAESDFDSRLRQLISNYRAEQGLGGLAFDAQLHELAREHSQNMQASGVLSHEGFTERFSRSGYGNCVENVGWNYPSPEAMLEGWRNSAGHNTNLLSRAVQAVGVSRVGAYITFFACGR